MCRPHGRAPPRSWVGRSRTRALVRPGRSTLHLDIGGLVGGRYTARVVGQRGSPSRGTRSSCRRHVMADVRVSRMEWYRPALAPARVRQALATGGRGESGCAVHEMRVKAVGVEAGAHRPVLLLEEPPGDHRLLPVWIVAVHGDAIMLEQRGISGPRQMTHPLI